MLRQLDVACLCGCRASVFARWARCTDNCSSSNNPASHHPDALINLPHPHPQNKTPSTPTPPQTPTSHLTPTPPHCPCARLSQELELKQHSLALLEERARGSEAHQLAEAVAATQGELEGAQQAGAEARERKQQLVAAAKVGGWCEGAGSGERMAACGEGASGLFAGLRALLPSAVPF